MQSDVINPLPLPTAFPDYEWRPARREDAQAIHELLRDVETVDQRGNVDTLDERERDFNDPSTNIATDTYLAFTPAGKVAAMGWIFSPPVPGDEWVAFVWGEIHPEHREQGLEDFIMEWMEARGRQILAQRPADVPHCLRAFCNETATGRVAMFERHGFERVRYSYRMRRDLKEPIPPVELPAGLRLAEWQPELDQATMDACNEAFEDHWGHIPFNYEAWQLWFSGHAAFRGDLSFIIIDEAAAPGSFQQVAGFTMNKIFTEENAVQGIQEGWIHELGVRRAWRKKGLATALLCASLHAFKNAGLEYAGLGVDTENLTGALRIYERLGFTPIRRNITFSKTVE